MRFRLPLGRTLFFVCVFLLAMVALIPMRFGLAWLQLDELGLAARETRGSVWNGAMVETQLGSAELGDVDAGLGFFPLLIGNARMALSREVPEGSPNGEFDGALTVSGADFGIDDMSARLPAADLFAPLPISSLSLQDVTAHFENGLCAEAEGLVRAEFTGASSPIPLPPALSGNARCDEGVLLLPMISQSGMEQLNLRIGSTGEYTLEFIVDPGDDARRERLTGAGFQPGANGYAMTMQGRF